MPTDPSALTAREREGLSLVAQGKTDREIAIILGVADATVRFHVDNARRKLGAVNRAHAVARFVLAECRCRSSDLTQVARPPRDHARITPPRPCVLPQVTFTHQ